MNVSEIKTDAAFRQMVAKLLKLTAKNGMTALKLHYMVKLK